MSPAISFHDLRVGLRARVDQVVRAGAPGLWLRLEQRRYRVPPRLGVRQRIAVRARGVRQAAQLAEEVEALEHVAAMAEGDVAQARKGERDATQAAEAASWREERIRRAVGFLFAAAAAGCPDCAGSHRGPAAPGAGEHTWSPPCPVVAERMLRAAAARPTELDSASADALAALQRLIVGEDPWITIPDPAASSKGLSC